MNQTENDRMIALMEHAVEHLAEHAEITLQDCEQILSDGKQNKNDMYLGFAHYYSGEAYYTLNNVEKVLYHISHAIGYLERANAWELVARAYNLTGITSIAIGNAAFAMNYYVQALACCRREGLSELENTVCINIGMLYYSYGEYEKARSYFTESLDYLTDHPETENHDQCVAVDHIGLGRCALHTGDLALAQECEQQILEIGGAYPDDNSFLTFQAALYHAVGETARRDACIGRIAMLHVEHIYSKSSDIVSISQGICWGYPAKDQRMADYLHAADDALYQVKKSERGKICLTVYSDIV